MHEMSYVLLTIEQLEVIIKENNVSELLSVKLNIGEASGVEEDFFRICWNEAIKDTDLKETKLIVNMIPSVGKCLSCNNTFEISKNNYTCPLCGKSNNFTPISGKDIEIVEIEAK